MFATLSCLSFTQLLLLSEMWLVFLKWDLLVSFFHYRHWQLRFDKNILSEKCIQWGVSASISDLKTNPYLLAEQYQGNDDSDSIAWSLVDRGVVPSPELAVNPLFNLNAEQRIRALLLETLRKNQPHVFMKASHALEQTNKRLEYLPEWKRVEVKSNYLTADKEFYQQTIIPIRIKFFSLQASLVNTSLSRVLHRLQNQSKRLSRLQQCRRSR